MSILNINDLALQLVALDFSDGHMPSNGGPTKTSRALAIIHLAAHDAYALVSGGTLTPMLAPNKIPNLPATLVKNEASGSAAMLCAGVRAATVLYPDFKKFITTESAKFSSSNEDGCCNDLACKYGEQLADAWIAARMNDGSSAPQLDTLYSQAAGRHRPDPLDPKQQALGRNWGLVTPFVLDSVVADAFLGEPPALTDPGYATAFNEVITEGKNNLPQTNPANAVIGIFWGYDGANKIGVPPRIYNQVIRAIDGFSMQPHELQIKVLTAINVAMADAGIAAWYWKYRYDVWRPVLGIREADQGWGPKGAGDNNPATTGDPFWLPLGAPSSNSTKPNGTPGFPAYPSGHATFGAACFETAAALLGSTPALTNVKFVSDEFNGVTTDNTGAVRPKYEDNFNLAKAIKDNNESRIWLGVHWRFDAAGGETVGSAIADKVCAKFKLIP
jgi:membrane-associated phospholipid phosphatase